MILDFLSVALLGKRWHDQSIEKLTDQMKWKKYYKYTNREVEAQAWSDVYNPNKYDEVWETIERYKIMRGEYAVKFPELWKNVGSFRTQFHDKSGNLSPRFKANRENAIHLLIMARGYLPQARAMFMHL